MAKLRHQSVGTQIDDEAEWMDDGLHEFDTGTTLPSTPEDADLFFKSDEKRLYIYIPD